MISIIAFILGALWGGRVAYKRGGSKADIAQYAAVHGLIFAIVAVIASILVIRLGWV